MEKKTGEKDFIFCKPIDKNFFGKNRKDYSLCKTTEKILLL